MHIHDDYAPPTALLSVYHKEGIVEFAESLVDQGWRLLSSTGTCRELRAAGLEVADVGDLVGEPILGHRVVTLSREVFAGILATHTADDQEEMARLGLNYIDLVCVDLYPLGDLRSKHDRTLDEVREITDIGGPTLLRAAAKGGRIVISKPEQRQTVLDWMRAGYPNEDEFLMDLAIEAELLVSNYCDISAMLLASVKPGGDDSTEEPEVQLFDPDEVG